MARAHPETDSATDAATNRCPQGVPKMSQIRSVGIVGMFYTMQTT